MAQMLPKVVAEHTASSAERRLFPRIRDELSDDWCVLHSLGMTRHARKPWAEIDFVLIGPPGIYCLEVKGGRIARTDGVWTTTDRYGKTSQLKESPFAQVGSAAAALRNFLVDAIPQLHSAVVGYAVAMPDIVFNIVGPDVEPGVVYDADNTKASFSEFIARIKDHWVTQSQQRWSKTPVPLEKSTRESVRNSLMRDFDLRPSFKSSVAAVHQDMIRFTGEQAAVLRGLSANPRLFVRGQAGTGKTVLALEETRRLLAAGANTLLTCKTRRLADFLSMQLAPSPSLTVQTFHGLMQTIIRSAGLSSRIPKAEVDDLLSVFYPELCLEALIEGLTECQFDAVVMDEGQDLLLNSYVDVLDVLLAGGLQGGQWRIFLDPNQNLFSGISLSGLDRLKAVSATDYELTINCRNTKEIAITSSLLSRLPPVNVLRVDGGRSETVFFSDNNDQRRKVSKTITRLIHSGVPAKSIVVLSPVRLGGSCLRNGLVGTDVGLVDPDDLAEAPVASVGYATVGSFKGLEADAVLLVDLEDLESDDFAPTAYVGATRAHAYLAVFIPDSESAAFHRLAVRFGQLTAGDQD